MKQMQKHGVFEDLGKNAPVPPGYKNIRVHMIFDVKHDGRRRARLVADGHLTDVPTDSVCSGVISLRGLRMLVFLAELNRLPLWATDISSACLEATTSEKVTIIAGPEFGELQGHRLIIKRALCGLRSSGLRWHEKFASCLRAEGFKPCLAEPDLWMRPTNETYECIGVYVDDLAFALKQPEELIKALQEKHNFSLKGTGPLAHHLGADFK